MLSNVPASKNSGVSRVTWTADEWRLVATELKSRFPDWQIHDFSMTEFEEAMEAVIGQERQRTYLDFEDVRPMLFEAFDAKNTSISKAGSLPEKIIKDATIASNGAIRWSPDQWEMVVLELHRLYPDVFADRLVKIGFVHAREAQKILPKHLHRQYAQLVNYRQMALKIWDHLPEDVRNPAMQVRPIIDFPSGPVMAPPKRKSDNESAIAIAVQKAFNDPQVKVITQSPRKKRVSWTPDEWLLIAREMVRQDPLGNLLNSTFPRIDLGALRAAQRKIFDKDNYKALKNPTGLRDPLVAAFAALKAEIQKDQVRVLDYSVAEESKPALAIEDKPIAFDRAAKARAALANMTPKDRHEAARRGHETRREKKAALAEKVAEAKPVAIAAAMQENYVAATAVHRETDFFGKIMNAALPLMNVLIDEAVTRLAPSLIAGMLPQLEKSMGSMLERALAEQMAKMVIPAAAPVAPVLFAATLPTEVVQDAPEQPQRLSKAEVMALLPQVVEKPKKPKIGLLMPTGAQREQIRSAYREYDFVFIDHGQGIKEAGQSCALFVALDAYVTAGNRQKLKDYIPQETLKYVNGGGISAIKRQINIWKAAQRNA